MLHPDRLFPADPATRAVARSLHDAIARLPIVSPHGHTDPQWWGDNTPFANAAELLVIPDHYVTRMLVSQGVPFEALGIGANAETDPRAIWRRACRWAAMWARRWPCCAIATRARACDWNAARRAMRCAPRLTSRG